MLLCLCYQNNIFHDVKLSKRLKNSFIIKKPVSEISDTGYNPIH